jgi:hypothetical protein
MNKKLNINLIQYLRLDLNQERIDKVLLLSSGYLWKKLDHKKNIFKEWVHERHEVLCEIRW